MPFVFLVSKDEVDASILGMRKTRAGLLRSDSRLNEVRGEFLERLTNEMFTFSGLYLEGCI